MSTALVIGASRALGLALAAEYRSLGGPYAALSIGESIPGVVATIERHRGEPGLQFLNHEDQVVPW